MGTRAQALSFLEEASTQQWEVYTLVLLFIYFIYLFIKTDHEKKIFFRSVQELAGHTVKQTRRTT